MIAGTSLKTEADMSELVLGHGPKPCSHMIIGEAPGAEEERQGAPFVGASGALIDEALEDIGRSREEFYITNVYKLRPPGNRNPTELEITAHSDLLRAEFQEVNPSVVLLLGRVARDAVLPDFAQQSLAETMETWFTWVGEKAPKFLVTYHPSFILRGGFPKAAWIDDIRIFAYET